MWKKKAQEAQTEPAGQETSRKKEEGRDLYEWTQALVCSVLAVVLLFTFVVRLIGVDGHSMVPTLQDGQRILISSLPYQPQYGDIIVTDAYTSYGEPLVKRVIGKAGDEIDIDFQNGIVYRNGQALDEPYTAEPTYLQESVEFPVTVPEDCLFVMGDNRNHSTDSRDQRVGFIHVNDVLGRVLR